MQRLVRLALSQPDQLPGRACDLGPVVSAVDGLAQAPLGRPGTRQQAQAGGLREGRRGLMELRVLMSTI